MTLPASGAISIGAINTEFSRVATTQTAMSQLYRGGGIVNSGAPNVPTSGAIALSQFYGASNYVSGAAQWLTPGFYGYTLPSTSGSVINIWCTGGGGGGGGGSSRTYFSGGGGGGAGARKVATVAVTPGQVIYIQVGAGGAGGAARDGQFSSGSAGGAGGHSGVLNSSQTVWYNLAYGGGGGGVSNGIYYASGYYSGGGYAGTSQGGAGSDNPGVSGGGAGYCGIVAQGTLQKDGSTTYNYLAYPQDSFGGGGAPGSASVFGGANGAAGLGGQWSIRTASSGTGYGAGGSGGGVNPANNDGWMQPTSGLNGSVYVNW